MATQSQDFTTPGAISWTIPYGVTSCFLTMIGGGGGAIDSGTSSIYGGGAGEYCEMVEISCLPTDPWVSSGAISGTVGTGGTQAAGTASNFGPLVCQPGAAGKSSTAGQGGGVGGGIGAPIQSGAGAIEGGSFTGGAGGGNAASSNYLSGPAINFPGVSRSGPLVGGSGGSSPFGFGGQGGAETGSGSSAASTAYGAGGGGRGTGSGTSGNGAGGRITVFWTA